MAKADLTAMEDLHSQVAKTLKSEIDRAKGSEDGVPASLLATAIKFLKDNHIEAGVGNADTSDLEKQMKHLQGMPYDGEVPAEYKQ